jgi:hypothetical protein
MLSLYNFEFGLYDEETFSFFLKQLELLYINLEIIRLKVEFRE